MSKKLLLGIVSIAACFSLGSTSFADASIVPTSSQVSQSMTSQVSAMNDVIIEITLRVGESRNLSGSNFSISGDQGNNSPIYLDRNGFVLGLKAGEAVVVADLPGGVGRVFYYIHIR
ncbi:hypothetical protein HUB98_09040 [Paenibacillus barcinonensis]|uniref:Uncharacterized protein n=1 Tax=Paenibacillus barcinonensis TaxID=198119 RepID=A0A2V4VBU9_PAEBA|nr:hypothetical protein [Paenibacillus barcinonensis]PYE49857.1 hypothetical protein DFQ00_105361 [Paenibacillus barcinonensis]QKS56470.1 hypothetical protein HUB98_09040 [Paenibacillus barcinonensis]